MSRGALPSLSFASPTSTSAARSTAFVKTLLVLRGFDRERPRRRHSAAGWGGYLTLIELGQFGRLAPVIARAGATGDWTQARTILEARVGKRR